jgi:hypothetical protein
VGSGGWWGGFGLITSMCIQALKMLFAEDRDHSVSKQTFNGILYEEWIAYARQHEKMLLKPGETWTLATEVKSVVKNRFDKMVLEANPHYDMKMLDVVRAVELDLMPKLFDNTIDLELFGRSWGDTYRAQRDVAHATPLEHSCRACCRTYTSSLSIYTFCLFILHLMLVSWGAVFFF